MADEAARAREECMKTDAALRGRVLAQQDAHARIAFVGAAGLDCPSEETEPAGAGALSDEEMTWVTGGLSPVRRSPGARATTPSPPDRSRPPAPHADERPASHRTA